MFLRNLVRLMVLVFTLYQTVEAKVVKCKYNFDNESVMFATGTLRDKVKIKRKIGKLQYNYHINNIKSFNVTEDYVTVTNDKNQKITYSLSCEWSFSLKNVVLYLHNHKWRENEEVYFTSIDVVCRIGIF